MSLANSIAVGLLVAASANYYDTLSCFCFRFSCEMVLYFTPNELCVSPALSSGATGPHGILLDSVSISNGSSGEREVY